MSVESEILNNKFIHRLRNEAVVDRAEYDHLVELLGRLSIQWNGQKLVDKAVVQELYVLAPVTKNIAESLRDHAPERASELETLAVELDALVLECLAD
jgi:hypothetical protein